MASTIRDVDTEAMRRLRAGAGRCHLSPREHEAVAATRKRMAEGYVFASAEEVRARHDRGGGDTP